MIRDGSGRRGRLLALTLTVLALTGWLAAACTSDEGVDLGGGDLDGSPGAASPTDRVGDAGSLAGSSWDLDAVVQAGARSAAVGGATLRFGDDGALSGSTGCNSFAGTYRQDGARLRTDPGATTRRACSDETVQAQEEALLRLLPRVRTFERADGVLTLSVSGGDSLVYSAGRTGVTGTWEVTGVNNGRGGLEGTALTPQLSLTFADDGAVSGSDGCNRFTGTSTVDGDRISVDVTAGTLVACEGEVGALADQFRAALANVATFDVTGDQLTLRDDQGAMQVTATAAG